MRPVCPEEKNVILTNEVFPTVGNERTRHHAVVAHFEQTRVKMKGVDHAVQPA